MKSLFKRAFLIWIGLFVLAFVNGAIREIGIKKFIDEPWAHHLSALTAVILFGIYVFIIWHKTKIETPKEALAVGGFWFLLTILTETFVLNRWISGLTWDQVIQTYNIFEGHRGLRV